MSYSCPRCGDLRTRKLSIMHGTSTRIGYRGGTSQTYLASSYSPPQSRAMPRLGCLIPFLSLLTLPPLLFIGLFLLFQSAVKVPPPHSESMNKPPVNASPFAAPKIARPYKKNRSKTTSQTTPANSPASPTPAVQALSLSAQRRILLIPAGSLAVLVCVILLLIFRWSMLKKVARDYNKYVLPVEWQRWNSYFICLNCEQLFIPQGTFEQAVRTLDSKRM